ncbi:MAG: hypothetical protein COA63_010785 [Methylophaga sp.]|nr:hypothetical protein [Methylophaga sp.]
MTDEQFEEGMSIINPVLAHLTYLTLPRADGKLRTMDDIASTFTAGCQANNIDVDLMLEDLVQTAEGIRIFGKGLMIAVARQKERGND